MATSRPSLLKVNVNDQQQQNTIEQELKQFFVNAAAAI